MNDFKNKLKNVEGVDSSILEAIKWGAPPPRASNWLIEYLKIGEK